MNIKILSFIIVSCLTLTACGGGGSGSNNPNNDNQNLASNQAQAPIEPQQAPINTTPQNNNGTWSNYTATGFDSVSFQKETLTIENGNVYNQIINTAESLYEPLDPLYFSPMGIYHNNQTSTKYGTQIGNILKKSDTEITYTPYTTQLNTADLIFTKKIRTIDISGQKVLNNVFNEQFNIMTSYQDWKWVNSIVGTAMYNWFKRQNETTFPAGSKCFSVITEESNIPFIRTDISLLSQTSTHEYDIESWSELKNSPTSFIVNMFNITGFFEKDNNYISDYGIIEYNGVRRFVEYFRGGIYYNINDKINSLESIVESFDEDEKVKFKKDLEHLKYNNCEFYNEVASQTIESNYLKF